MNLILKYRIKNIDKSDVFRQKDFTYSFFIIAISKISYL